MKSKICTIIGILLLPITYYLLPVSAQQTLTLSQCRELALKNNIAMHSADSKLQQAQQQKKEAFTNFFPQVSGTGITLHSNRDMIKGSINTSDVLPSELGSMIPAEMASMIPSTVSMGMLRHVNVAGVTAIQPVFAGGQIVNGNKLAKVGIEVSGLQKKQSENEVLRTVEQYYWKIVSAKSKLKTVNAIAEMLRSIENDAQNAITAGVALRNDLLQVQLKQNEVESNRIKLENKLKVGKMLLAQYIGLDENTDIDVVVPATVPDTFPSVPELAEGDYPLALKQDAATAVQNTPEYNLLQKNVEATTLQRRMEIGKNLPSVGVGAGYNYMRMMGTDNNFGMVFATVSVPISGWWGGSHAIKRRKLAEQNAREQLTENAELLKIRLQSSWNDLNDAYQQLQIARKSIEQSTENLRINRDQYKAGTIKMSDLLQAQSLYQQSQDQYTDAYTDYQNKKITYRQSAGRY